VLADAFVIPAVWAVCQRVPRNPSFFMSKPKSRAERFSAALDIVADAKSQIEELRDELQNWLDGMPENLQASSKADELDNAISELDGVISSLEDAEGASVEFPGMF